MNEIFNEYKEILESNMIGISYLYSGDVISSELKSNSENIENKMESTFFIKNTVEKIYKQSIDSMFKRSLVINKSLDFKKIDKNSEWLEVIIKSLDIDFIPKYAFVNDFSKLGIVRNIEDRYLPSYFYWIDKIKDTKLYRCPYINIVDDDEMVIYLVSDGIQSMVYSIQNMEYTIEEPNIHTIFYKFYNCNYKSYKLIIKDTQKMRNDKIDSIISTY